MSASCSFSFDDTAAHILLIDENDRSVQGTLRILSYPLHTDGFVVHDAKRKDYSPPGGGRTESEVAASLVQAQKLSADGDTLLLSGAKIGRVAIRAPYRGCGAGRYLMMGAEEWIAKALSHVSVKPDTKKVYASIHLSSQSQARRFYDRYVKRLTQPWVSNRQCRVSRRGRTSYAFREAHSRARTINIAVSLPEQAIFALRWQVAFSPHLDLREGAWTTLS